MNIGCVVVAKNATTRKSGFQITTDLSLMCTSQIAVSSRGCFKQFDEVEVEKYFSHEMRILKIEIRGINLGCIGMFIGFLSSTKLHRLPYLMLHTTGSFMKLPSPIQALLSPMKQLNLNPSIHDVLSRNSLTWACADSKRVVVELSGTGYLMKPTQ